MDSPTREDYFREDLSSKADDFQSNNDTVYTETEATEPEKLNAARQPDPPGVSNTFDVYPTDHRKIIPINAQTQCCKSPRIPHMPQFFFAQKHKSVQEESNAKRFCRKSPILAFQNRKIDHNTVDHSVKTEQLKQAASHDFGCCPYLRPMATESQTLHYRVHRKNNTSMAPMVSLRDKAKYRVLVKKRKKAEKQQNEQSQSPTQRQTPSPAPRTSLHQGSFDDQQSEERRPTRSSGEAPPTFKQRTTIEPAPTPPNSRQSSHPSSWPSNQANRPSNVPDSHRMSNYPESRVGSGSSNRQSEYRDNRAQNVPNHNNTSTSYPENNVESVPNSRQSSRRPSKREENNTQPNSRDNTRQTTPQQHSRDNTSTPPQHSRDNTRPNTPPQHSRDNTRPATPLQHSRDNTRPTTPQPHSRDNTRPTTPQQYPSESQPYPRGSQNDDPFEATSHDIPPNPTDTTYQNPTNNNKRLPSQPKRESNDSRSDVKRDQSAAPDDSMTDEPDSSPESKDTTNAVIYGRGFGFLPDRTIVSSRSISQTKRDTRKRAISSGNPIVSQVESQFNDVPAE